ncbi:MAG: hypothetical protein AB7U46_10795 [Paenirhodobacter sp.]|uniref:hypothetical protein n=1 Tax=Paenirhodobacter sp. TaxID=1965326 RepID=UPI003D150DED
MHRRTFTLSALAGAAALCPLCARAQQGAAAQGRAEDIVLCASGGGAEMDELNRVSGTGTAALDRALSEELNSQSRFFNLRPAFYIYTGGLANAFATLRTFPETPQTDGSILYQKALLLQHLSQGALGGSVVAGVIAHEFSHIAQYHHAALFQRLRDRHRSVKFVELHADYMAGFYMGNKFADSPEQIDTFAQALFELGDDHFSQIGHHGTPEQRYVAMKAGFNYYRSFPGRGIEPALLEGEAFIREYFPAFDRKGN